MRHIVHSWVVSVPHMKGFRQIVAVPWSEHGIRDGRTKWNQYIPPSHNPPPKIAGCACAGNAGNVFPATASYRSRHASRHVRHARAVMHDGLITSGFLWSRWRGKRSRRGILIVSMFLVSDVYTIQSVIHALLQLSLLLSMVSSKISIRNYHFITKNNTRIIFQSGIYSLICQESSFYIRGAFSF